MWKNTTSEAAKNRQLVNKSSLLRSRMGVGRGILGSFKKMPRDFRTMRRVFLLRPRPLTSKKRTRKKLLPPTGFEKLLAVLKQAESQSLGRA
jgi:hypothetical protein